MFCTTCGTQNPDTSKFCTSCGAPLQTRENQQTADAQQGFQAQGEQSQQQFNQQYGAHSSSIISNSIISSTAHSSMVTTLSPVQLLKGTLSLRFCCHLLPVEFMVFTGSIV
ncbi:MAG: zinc ribbon domain-containing protein [Ruminococcus sp.]|nr:zinc ribbon domain-containing protein [Ruminococcus sp.]